MSKAVSALRHDLHAVRAVSGFSLANSYRVLCALQSGEGRHVNEFCTDKQCRTSLRKPHKQK